MLSSCSKPAPLEEAPAELLSEVNMVEPRGLVQLVHGFSKLEGDWRWTAGKFSVVLKPPSGAATKGAQLRFELDVPPVIIEKLGPITIETSVNGTALPPETFREVGTKVLVRDVPAALLADDAVAIDFSTSKVLDASAIGEDRELGVVARRFALASR